MSKFFIDRPIFAIVIALLMMLAGALSILTMPIEQYPTIAPPSIQVTTQYPGASASTVESTVVQVVEQHVGSGLSDADLISSATALAEGQHETIVQSETDPAFIKELKARLDESKMTRTQINLEFGAVQSISYPEPAGRQQAVDHVKQWMDIAVQYGCPRVMINQQQAQLTKETRDGAVAAMKAMADYGRPKNVKVSFETRGAGIQVRR